MEEAVLKKRAIQVCKILTDIGLNEGPLIFWYDILDCKSDLNFVMCVRLMLLNQNIYKFI